MKYNPIHKDKIYLYQILSVLLLFGTMQTLAASKSTSMPQTQITGIVIDIKGTPIVGANIQIKNTNNGTVSNFDGSYSITARPTDVLVFSVLGYQTEEILIGSQTQIDVTLEEAITQLDEVTLNAGYYTVKEKERTSNISKITAKTIKKQPVSNLLSVIQGRMPGVYITQNTGVPGGSFNIEIRGRNSIASGNSPLYIVNGVPFNSSIPSSLGNQITRGGNPLNGIDLSNIESIEVLKDADATAIYGSRGANGVVLITTKKGHIGKTQFNVELQSGMGAVAHKMDILNREQYLMMRREAFTNDGVTPTTTNARDLLLWDTNRYTDWQDKLIGATAHLTNAQASVSGGSKGTSFQFGGGLRKETTVFPGDFNYKKATGHAQLNHRSKNNRFHVVFSGNYTSETNKLFSQDLTALILLPPVAPKIYDDEGLLNWGPDGGSFNNPFSIIEKDYRVRTQTLLSHIALNYQIFKGLNAKIGMGYSTTQTNEIQTTPTHAINPGLRTFLKATSNVNHTMVQSWIVEPQLEYKKNIGKSMFKILLGSTLQQQTTDGQSTFATDFSSDLLLENVGAAGTTRSNTIFTDYKYQGVFGRLNYNYDSKYIVNITARRDGSSRFGPGNRFANFGALGVTWIFSNEPFFKDSPVLSFGKLRGSYGITGNDQIGDYRYVDSYKSTTYPYQNILGLRPTRLFNPLYGWETNKKFEAAIDLGFLRDRFRFSTVWYRNRSSNQLVGYPLPATAGFSSIQSNLPAEVENTGFELELNTANVNNKDFRWTTTANLSIPKNELLAYPNIENSSFAQTYTIGKSLSLVRVYHTLGVNPQTGIYEFEDLDGNGIINLPNDLQSLVELDPKFYGGIGNSFSYKGIQLDVFLQFVKQKGYNPIYLSGAAPGRLSNQQVGVLHRWQQPGNQTHIQQFTQSTNSAASTAFNNSLFNGDHRFSDASFIRLKTVSLSYRIPQGILANVGSEIYLQGQNLLTFTGYDGLDPETNGSLRLPPLRMISMGMRLTF